MHADQGPGARHRADGIRKEYDAGGDGRPHQRIALDHILTIEDPIEFVHPNKKSLVNQREIRTNTKSFANALRAALREDPDVILVGEMRDRETIELGITAAETGHLVFGTLHTNSAPKTVDRIIDVFPADEQEQIRSMLGESLKGVIAQVLLRHKDGKSRMAAMEIMVGTSAIGNLIRENKIHQIPSIIQTGKKDGMQLLDQHILEFLMAGKITPEEAYMNATTSRPSCSTSTSRPRPSWYGPRAPRGAHGSPHLADA